MRLPWIRQAALRSAQRDAAAPRIRTALVLARNARQVRISKSVGSADGCLAVALRVPGQAAARIEVPPFAVRRGLFRKSGIAGEVESLRCIRKYGALGARQKPAHIEVRDLAVLDLLRQERIPADAEVERQARADLPGIGEIDVHHVLPRRVRVWKTLQNAAQIAQQKIGGAGAGDRAGKQHVGPGGGEVIEFDNASLQPPKTERHLVGALQPTDVVIKGAAVAVPKVSIAQPATEIKTAADGGVAQLSGRASAPEAAGPLRAIAHAGVAESKQVRALRRGRGAVECKPRGVHHGGTDHESVADRG